MSALLDLAERCEKAEGPDRELDARIDCLLKGRTGFAWIGYYYNCDQLVSAGGSEVPKWTASLDAALTLVPEGWSVLATWNPTGRCKCDLSDGPMDGQIRQWVSAVPCATPALALCAAALRARHTMEGLS